MGETLLVTVHLKIPSELAERVRIRLETIRDLKDDPLLTINNLLRALLEGGLNAPSEEIRQAILENGLHRGRPKES